MAKLTIASHYKQVYLKEPLFADSYDIVFSGQLRLKDIACIASRINSATYLA